MTLDIEDDLTVFTVEPNVALALNSRYDGIDFAPRRLPTGNPRRTSFPR